MSTRGAIACIALLLASALVAVGCDDSDDENAGGGSQIAGVYQGVIIQSDGNFAAVTGYLTREGVANLVVRRRMDRAAGVASGSYTNGRYSGKLSRPDRPPVPILFHDQNGSPHLIVSRLGVSGLEGKIRLQRQNSTTESALPGHYAFVDQVGHRWEVHVAAEGAVTATANQGQCSFHGQLMTDAGTPKLGVLTLSAGPCAPFDDTPTATVYLQADAVGSVDLAHVVFRQFNEPYDWYWFAVD